LDKEALPIIDPLMTSDSPEVAFIAARAAAFIGEPTAQQVLLGMARTKNHPFQIDAVKVLGELPSSPEINLMLRSLLDSDEDLVRIEAYRVLAENQDSSVYSRLMPNDDPKLAKFILDIVPSKGRPLIYASRRGLPRIAVIGGKPSLAQPVLCTAFDNRLSISSDPNSPNVIIFYRDRALPKPVNIISRPDVAEIIARLAGAGPVAEANLDFSYCDIVAILQKLADSQSVVAIASDTDPRPVPTPFILEALPHMDDAIDQAPVIPDQTRPQADATPVNSLPNVTIPARQ
jgi:hypothetical protein